MHATALATAAAAIAAKPRFTIHPDGRFIDHDRIYRAADGSLYCCEWSPTLNPDEELSQPKAVALAQACTLDAEGGAWDAPEAYELAGLVDRSRYSPAIAPELAADTKSDWYWTKTADASVSSCAWFVDFYHGNVSYYPQYSGGFVRAVRRVPASQ